MQVTARAEDILNHARDIVLINGVSVAESTLTSEGSGFQLTPFDYYVQQGDGSEFEKENCGPATVAMALRYSSGMRLAPSPQEVRVVYMQFDPQRKNYRTGPKDVERALDFAGARYREVHGAEGVWRAVHRYHTVIVPVRMRDVTLSEHIRYSFDGYCPPRRNLYLHGDNAFCFSNPKNVLIGNHMPFAYDMTEEYDTGDAHVILANGVFTDTQGERYFYLYDPNVFGTQRQTYFYFGDNRLPKGKYRLWSYAELDRALKNNTNNAVEVLHNPSNPIPILNAHPYAQLTGGSNRCASLDMSQPGWELRFLWPYFGKHERDKCHEGQLKKMGRGFTKRFH